MSKRNKLKQTWGRIALKSSIAKVIGEQLVSHLGYQLYRATLTGQVSESLSLIRNKGVDELSFGLDSIMRKVYDEI